MVRIRENERADLAPFAEQKSWQVGADIGLEWDETREIVSLRVRWERLPDAPVTIQYWRGDWPEKRPPDSGAALGGWYHEGDLFNGEWRTADADIDADDLTWTITFGPVNRSEFPDLADYAVPWRATRKLRLVSASGLPPIERIEAFGRSVWRERDVVVETEGAWGSGPADDQIEVYNGHLVSSEPLTDGNGVHLSLRATDARTGADRTVVTLRGAPRSFSFAVDDLDDGPLYVRDLGALVSLQEAGARYAPFVEEWERDHPKTYYERIGEEPEQTLSRAWADMPPKKQFYFPLGVEGRRQRFGVEPDGTVYRRGTGYIREIPGRDTDRLGDDPDRINWSFGLPAMPPSARTPLRGYLPALVTEWETGGLRYRQTVCAALAGGDPSLLDVNAPGARADDPVVAVVRIDVTNVGLRDKTCGLRLSVSGKSPEEVTLGESGLVANGIGKLRARVAADRPGALRQDGGAIAFRTELPPGGACRLDALLAYHDMDGDERRALCLLNVETLLKDVVDYWERRIAHGTRIVTPEPMINDFYRAHVAHMLINHERHVDASVDIARVGSFSYAAFANESVMQISDLDRRGYHNEAARGYETWVRYQGSVMLSGDFDTAVGCFHGAGGYECLSYNQNHGWVLWGMAEHYLLTRDEDWIARVAPAMVAACDWIVGQRKRTMRTGPDGKRVIEYGFLPAGELEDIRDWQILALDERLHVVGDWITPPGL